MVFGAIPIDCRRPSVRADVNAKTNRGRTPLYWAATKGYKDVAELLREHGGHE